MIAVDRVRRMMFAIEISVESGELLPLDHRKRGIESVQFRDLNVPRVIVIARVHEADPLHLPNMITLEWGARRDPDNAAKLLHCVQLDAHSNIDERNTVRFAELDDGSLRFAFVDANEYEVHL